jgi:hypothetical protein
MARKKRKSSSVNSKKELDGVYVLKLVMYLVIGSQWLRLTDSDMTTQIPLPIGLLFGGFFAGHEHFQIDRKIEYAVLLVACLIGFWSQTGLFVSILN